MELIDLIHEDLLKSAELTGIWEKKLRDIEHKKYDAQQFIEELKAQVTEIVNTVMSDASNRHVAVTTEDDLKQKRKRTAAKPQAKPSASSGTVSQTRGDVSQTPDATNAGDSLIGQPCPLCGRGHIVKGKTAYGCSEWKSGCTWRKPFE
jgi:DNA topoisomerase-3